MAEAEAELRLWRLAAEVCCSAQQITQHRAPVGFTESRLAKAVAVTLEPLIVQARAGLPADVSLSAATVLVTSGADDELIAGIQARLERRGSSSPFQLLQSVPNSIVGYLAAKHQVRGAVITVAVGEDRSADEEVDSLLAFLRQGLEVRHALVVEDRVVDAAGSPGAARARSLLRTSR